MRRLLVMVFVIAGCGTGTNVAPTDAPGPIPAVDLTRHAVPLEEIVFDTFDGGSVPLSEADAATIDRLLDAIPPIDDPRYESPPEATWLETDDVVLGYVDDDGRAWAYPVKILNFHEIVNDVLADRPVLVSYCPLCGSGIVYDRRVGNDLLSFSNTSALHENDMVMVDRESGSYWWQVAGVGIVGPRTDEVLEPRPSEMIRWSDWTRAHPDGRVLVRPGGGRDYSFDPFSGYAERVNGGRTPFPVSEEALRDERLPAGATVIAAEIGGVVRAWPVAETQTRTETIDGTEYEITTDGVGGTVEHSASGTPLAVRTLLWFALVAAEPGVVLAG